MSDFVWSDSWLLLSLIYGRGPIDRKRIREIGDFINYAIFTDQELTGGLRRLRNHGHVRRAGKKYEASTGVMKWYIKATKGKTRTYVSTDLKRVELFLSEKK